MAYDEGLAERLRELFSEDRNVTEKKMFGGLAFMSGDYMFVGILGEALMARVGKENHESVLARPHVRVMDFTGKSLKGYVFVDPPGYAEDEDLAAWVKQCRDFVQTLPPKERK